MPDDWLEKLRRMLSGMPNEPHVQRLIDETPSTGHWEGNVNKMVKEVNNWPHAWMPETSPARNRLKQRMAADSDETYVYYPIGAHHPVIWDEGQRWTLTDYQEKYGNGG